MPTSAYSQMLVSIYDAVLDTERVPAALRCVSEYAGCDGATFLLVDKRNNMPCSAAWWGCIDAKPDDYLAHYGKIDPYLAKRQHAPLGRWVPLRELLDPAVLARDEWYNDFFLASGVSDVTGAKLHETDAHIALIGLLQAAGSGGRVPRNPDLLTTLIDPLSRAAEISLRMREIGLQLTLNRMVVDHLAAGVILADDDGRVLEANPSAEAILALGDGLSVRAGRLCARRSFETAKLANLIAAAASRSEPSAASMLVGREGGKPPYVVSFTPLGGALSPFHHPVAIVSIAPPAEASATMGRVAELYGLSPAESRLTMALGGGKRLSAIAAEFGVQISTLRSQLSAILRKLDVQRQSDIMRIVSSTSIWTTALEPQPARELKSTDPKEGEV